MASWPQPRLQGCSERESQWEGSELSRAGRPGADAVAVFPTRTHRSFSTKAASRLSSFGPGMTGTTEAHLPKDGEPMEVRVQALGDERA